MSRDRFQPAIECAAACAMLPGFLIYSTWNGWYICFPPRITLDILTTEQGMVVSYNQTFYRHCRHLSDKADSPLSFGTLTSCSIDQLHSNVKQSHNSGHHVPSHCTLLSSVKLIIVDNHACHISTCTNLVVTIINPLRCRLFQGRPKHSSGTRKSYHAQWSSYAFWAEC